jgi:hypothetical protein
LARRTAIARQVRPAGLAAVAAGFSCTISESRRRLGASSWSFVSDENREQAVTSGKDRNATASNTAEGREYFCMTNDRTGFRG